MAVKSLVRISFELDPADWHGNASERLWAEPVRPGEFLLRNTPFFAMGVANEDVVFGELRDTAIWFAGVAEYGGHSTYRLILMPGAGDAEFQTVWAPLAAFGCTFEGGGPVIAVDVPPSADIDVVYSLLRTGEIEGVWDFEEGHCARSTA